LTEKFPHGKIQQFKSLKKGLGRRKIMNTKLFDHTLLKADATTQNLSQKNCREVM